MAKDYKDILGRLFPALEIKHQSEVDIGWSSQILLVNGEYVVKIPKTREASTGIEKEMSITEAIRDTLSVLIPEYVASIFNDELVAAAYRFIEGSMFTTQPVKGEIEVLNPTAYLGSDKRSEVARQIGETLSFIHSIETGIVEPVLKRYVTDNWEEKISSWFLECRKIAEMGLSPEELAISRKFLDNLEKSFNNFNYTRKFIHGDFGGWNMLFDPETLKFTGLLDWADSRIGDPARDFTELLYDFGEPFTLEILHHYGIERDPGIMERAKLYLRLAGFQDLKYGMETGSEFFTKRGKMSIIEELKNFADL